MIAGSGAGVGAGVGAVQVQVQALVQAIPWSGTGHGRPATVPPADMPPARHCPAPCLMRPRVEHKPDLPSSRIVRVLRICSCQWVIYCASRIHVRGALGLSACPNSPSPCRGSRQAWDIPLFLALCTDNAGVSSSRPQPGFLGDGGCLRRAGTKKSTI